MRSSFLLVFVLIVACGKPPPPPPPTVRTTYRILAGISGGAIAASSIGVKAHERFDALGLLGGPMDTATFLSGLDRYHLSGFCPRERLEALLAQDPSLLNSPAAMAACRSQSPTLREWERADWFNAWPAGGSPHELFHRSMFLRMFTDVTLTHGNLFTENPASAFAPSGVDVAHVRHPSADFCKNPVRVKRLYNAEYNPQGIYDAITFCDGQPRLFYCRTSGEAVDFCKDPANLARPLRGKELDTYAAAYCQSKGGAEEAQVQRDYGFLVRQAGKVSPCVEATEPVDVALAFDLNGNGRRDLGEPLVNNSHERFDDVGEDGCPNEREDGRGGCTAQGAPNDPNGDDYHPDHNSRGTEGDWVWEAGEPFRDDGLDGVSGTHDVGEANGAYDVSSGRRSLLEQDGRLALRRLSLDATGRLRFFVDAGIRDVANFGAMSRQFFGMVNDFRQGTVGRYRDFTEIPGMTDKRSGAYNPWNGRWRTVPRDLLLLYGKSDPTEDELVAGDGDHVGTNTQAVYRFYTLFNWAAAEWPSLPKPTAPSGGLALSERQKLTWFASKALGSKREYGVVLPAGYEHPENADVRYPVLYFFPGYGTSVSDMMAITLVYDAFVQDPTVRLRPMILVFPSMQCCFTHANGQRDCREADDQGAPFTSATGWTRDCRSSVFSLNARGLEAGAPRAYEDAFFELMDVVDATYRTLSPADVVER